MSARTGAILVVAALLVVPAAAQSQTQTAPAQPESAQSQPVEPEHIQVQHVLIGFQGSVSGKTITRSPEEAKALAYEILGWAREGEDFDALVKKYTDDAHPGIYAMANHGVEARPGEFRRAGMVKAFGDVGFPMAVGEVGIADYDPTASRYGWHIIKRIE